MSGFGYNILGFGGGGPPPPPPEVDDEFNRVSFLSHFDGANNGDNNAFDDGSASNHTITAVANSTQGSFGPFARPDGEWAVALDGDGDYLTVAASNDFDVSDGDITWEMFVNPSQAASTGGNQLTLFEYFDSGAFFRFIIYVVNGSFNISIFQRYDGDYPLSADNVAPANTWSHVACTRDSNNEHKIFVNGVTVATSTNNNDVMPTAGLPLTIGLGQLTPGGRYFPGHISNFRLTKGSLVYTSDFTPPSAPLTAITNCKLLTCQSSRIVDNSASAHTVTPSGNPSVSAFGPFLTDAAYDPAVNGAGAYFEGTGDYISAANSAEFYMDDAAYTIEFWFFDSPPSSQYVFDNYAGGDAGGMNLYLTTAGKIGFRFSSTTDSYKDHDTGDGAFIKGSWNHIAIVRTYASSNTTLVTYANGVAKKTTTFNDITAKINTSEILTIGDAFQGYITDFRLVKGTAVYTGNFTPPTAPLTAITNTKLLLNMADGQAIDSTAQNNLTLYGTAKLSTGQAKFGDTSILFDGNSDFATFPHSESNDISGIGNWTVEFYWRFVDNDATQYQEIATKGVGFQLYANNGALAIALSASNNSTYFKSASNGTTLSDNTWYHIAVVKNGTGYKVYLDGTSESNLAVTSSSNVDTGTSPWCLGAYTSNNYYANGYMDEFRVSKFARYTGNFTAPTEPFPSQGQL